MVRASVLVTACFRWSHDTRATLRASQRRRRPVAPSPMLGSGRVAPTPSPTCGVHPLTISVRDAPPSATPSTVTRHCEPCRWPDATVKSLAWCTSVAEVGERTGAAVADERLEPGKTRRPLISETLLWLDAERPEPGVIRRIGVKQGSPRRG